MRAKARILFFGGDSNAADIWMGACGVGAFGPGACGAGHSRARRDKAPAPPTVATAPVTDNYFGTKVTDNYRWLEDAGSDETKKFIDNENAYTTRYFDQVKILPDTEDDLDALEHVEQWGLPIERGDDYFFEKRLAGEDQTSIYVRHGWAGKEKRLIDPAQLSKDPNTSVTLEDVSRDGSMIEYRVRLGGADEGGIHVFDVKAGKPMPDELPSALYWSVNFTPEGRACFMRAATARARSCMNTYSARGTRRTRFCLDTSFAASCWGRMT